MKAYNIIHFLEKQFPLNIQSQNDNSGLQIGSPEKNIQKVIIAYEKTLDVISKCVMEKCDMLITHRPLSIPKRFGPPPITWWKLFKKIIKDSDMVIYSLHENLDFANNGTGVLLTKELGLSIIEQKGEYLICKMREVKFKNFVLHIRQTLKPDYIIAVGEENSKIIKVGVVAGTAMNIKDIEFFKSRSVDCYLSGDPDDFGIRYSRDLKIPTINIDDYSLERPGIFKIYSLLKNKFKEIKIEFIDCRYHKIYINEQQT